MTTMIMPRPNDVSKLNLTKSQNLEDLTLICDVPILDNLLPSSNFFCNIEINAINKSSNK